MQGRVALITGGSRGIGYAIGERLAKEGVRLAVVARKPEEAVTRLREKGFEAVGLPMDLEQADPAEAVAATVEVFGRLDILVHAAGLNIRKPALEMSYEEWRRIQYLHVDVAFLLAKAAAPHMRELGWGRILFIASIQSFIGGGPLTITAYNTAKTALLGLMRGLAKEWAPWGIRVNALAPGFTKTEFNVPLWSNPESYQLFASRIPVGRWAEPEEMAGAGAFLCSEEAGYITGQVLVVDGGYLIY